MDQWIQAVTMHLPLRLINKRQALPSRSIFSSCELRLWRLDQLWEHPWICRFGDHIQPLEITGFPNKCAQRTSFPNFLKKSINGLGTNWVYHRNLASSGTSRRRPWVALSCAAAAEPGRTCSRSDRSAALAACRNGQSPDVDFETSKTNRPFEAREIPEKIFIRPPTIEYANRLLGDVFPFLFVCFFFVVFICIFIFHFFNFESDLEDLMS